MNAVKRPPVKQRIVPYRFVDEEFPCSSWHWKGYRDLFETLPAGRAGCFGCGSAGQLAQLEGSLAAEKATMGLVKLSEEPGLHIITW